MSLQNLTAATSADNLQLFSKALQENGGQQGAVDGHPDSHGHQNQQTGGISAADLQQFMLSQLDQQLYLSQLTSGFGTGAAGGPETSISSALFLPSDTSIDSVTTTTSSQNGTTTTTTTAGTTKGEEMIQQLKQQSSNPPAISSTTADGPTDMTTAAQMAQQQQNLMEQLLEAAASQQNNSMDGTQNGGGGGGQTAEEIGQLMAQLMAANGGGGQVADQLQAQLLQQLANARGDVQSPSQQQIQQLSLFDQLQVLQILGGQGNNVPGLADFLAGAGGNSALSQLAANSMGHDFAGSGMMIKGGSPNKDADTYCDICNKNVCNRYFLKTHKEKKHGIFNGSPTKFNNGGSEISQFGFHKLEEPPGRAQSASLQQQNQQSQQRDSPSSYHQHQRQKQSLSSTPGLGAGTYPPTNSSLNDTTDHQQQLLNQCIMQQLAAQLAIPTSNQNGQERSALIEQILSSAGLPLSELLQQQQNCRSSPAHSSPGATTTDQFPCAHCVRQFPNQSALFQHQLSEHIGTTNEQHWPIGGDGGATQQQQQQFLGQLLASPSFPGQNNAAAAAASLMLPSFGQMNGGADMDGAAMLAKLSAELAAVSQQQNGQGGGLLHGQNHQQIGNGGIHQHQQNGGQIKAIPQKRQYQSTSKNFCDLCNKDVCNKYFLRTHMLKMHNIVIDENKVVIANIDTAEKERKGEVKFRCEICGNSMRTRELLKLHKREVHGMQPIAIQHSMPTPPSAKTSGAGFGLVSRASMEMMGEAGLGGRKLSSASTFTPPTINKMEQQRSGGEHATTALMGGGGQMQKMSAANDENHQPPQMERADGGERGGGGGSATLPISSVKQLLSQLYNSSADPGGEHLHQMNIKKEDSQDDQQYNQNTGNNNTPGPQQQQNDANNNPGLKCCRFCGIFVESEQELELHQLVNHLDLVHSGLNNQQPQQEAEEKLVTQVALEMAKANSQKKNKKTATMAVLRKSSAASSGGASSSSSQSSSSAASSAQSASSSALLLQQQQSSPSSMKGVQIQATNHPCPQCKRTYKTVAKLEAHQRMVHQHNFVAKISPSKRTLTISPKKISKMLKCFSCMRCRQRFSTKMECNEHVISAHIRPAEREEEDGNSRMKRAKIDGEEEEEEGGADEECRQGLLREWVREVDGESREEDEEDDEEDGHGNSLGPLVVDEGEMMNEAEGKKEGAERTEECHRQMDKPTLGGNVSSGKEGGEKHSHTSGSTSPASVQASHSSLVLPEGFAHPHPEHQKPFLLQYFTVRPIHPSSADGASNSAENNNNIAAAAIHHALPDELVAYLPVRAQLNERVRVTLELQPNPLIDSQVRHL